MTRPMSVWHLGTASEKHTPNKLDMAIGPLPASRRLLIAALHFLRREILGGDAPTLRIWTERVRYLAR